jgi:glycosyltransferase involved in cell wall biosynthesis
MTVKVLLLHNRYQIAGGEDGVVAAEQQLLRDRGHPVAVLEVSNDAIQGGWQQLQAARNAIYSFQSKQKVRALIQEFRPDVVHVHNFFPLLSPSVYDACEQEGVAVVQTLHNYRLGCPKAMFFRDSQICEACLGQPLPWPSIRYGCYRESRAQTAVVATMLAWHRWQQTWWKRVSAFITLTEFQKQKLVQAGLPPQRMYVKPNFLFPPPPFSTEKDPTFLLFVGRLSQEKGVSVLIEAYRRQPDLPPLKIVGDGPLHHHLQEQVRQAHLTQQISFLGRQGKTEILQLMHQALALVFPSIWYEGFPLTIAEALACGLPVIAPQLGSMAEIIADGCTGLHFLPQDSLDLASKIRWLTEHPQERRGMAQSARQVYQQRYTPEVNYAHLISIYQAVSCGSPLRLSQSQ